MPDAADLRAAREAWRTILVLDARMTAAMDRAATDVGTLPPA